MSALVFGLTLLDFVRAASLLPLLAFLVLVWIALLECRAEAIRYRPLVMTVAVGSSLGSFLCLMLTTFLSRGEGGPVTIDAWLQWFFVYPWRVSFAYWLDPLSFGLALPATGLSVLISLVMIGLGREERRLSAQLALVQGMLFSFLLIALTAEGPLWVVGWEGLVLGTGFLLWLGDRKTDRPLALPIWIIGHLSSLLLWSTLAGIAAVLTPEASLVGGLDLSLATLIEYQELLADRLPWLPWFLLGATLIATVALPACGVLKLVRQGFGELAWLGVLSLPTAAFALIARLHFIVLWEPFLLKVWLILGVIMALGMICTALFQTKVRAVLGTLYLSQVGQLWAAIGLGAFASAFWFWWVGLVAWFLLVIGAALLVHYQGHEYLIRMKPMPLRSWAFFAVMIGGISLAGLLPLGGFLVRQELVWQAFVHGHYRSAFFFLLTALLMACAVGRFWGLAFFGRRPGTDMPRMESLQRTSIALPLVTLVAGLFLLSGFKVWELIRGTEMLQTWIGPVFEDFVPIRSEAHGVAAEKVLLTIGCLLQFHVGLVTILLYAQKYVWMERLRVGCSPLLLALQSTAQQGVRLGQALIAGPVIVVRGLFASLIEENLMRGLMIQGTVGLVHGSSRLVARLQSGQIGHYLLWIFLSLLGVLLWQVWS